MYVNCTEQFVPNNFEISGQVGTVFTLWKILKLLFCKSHKCQSEVAAETRL